MITVIGAFPLFFNKENDFAHEAQPPFFHLCSFPPQPLTASRIWAIPLWTSMSWTVSCVTRLIHHMCYHDSITHILKQLSQHMFQKCPAGWAHEHNIWLLVFTSHRDTWGQWKQTVYSWTMRARSPTLSPVGFAYLDKHFKSRWPHISLAHFKLFTAGKKGKKSAPFPSSKCCEDLRIVLLIIAFLCVTNVGVWSTWREVDGCGMGRMEYRMFPN